MMEPVISGVATSLQGKAAGEHKSSMGLAAQQVISACEDAGLSPWVLDGVVSRVSGLSDGGGLRLPQEGFWARQLGRPLRWATENPNIVTLLDAAAAIRDNRASHIVFVSSRVSEPFETSAPWVKPFQEFTSWTGSFTAAQYALVANQYLQRYGSDKLIALARVTADIRNNGHHNTHAAHRGRPDVTAEDVLKSPMIAEPITRMMCSIVSDGAGALIVSAADELDAAHRGRSIRVLGGDQRISYPPYVEPPAWDPSVDFASETKAVLGRLGLTLDDMDVLELYDHFSIGVLLELEFFGFVGPGEAPEAVIDGIHGLDGRFPVSTDGGNLAFSHNGYPHIFRVIEAVRQLRGEVLDECFEQSKAEHSYIRPKCLAVNDVNHAFVSNPGAPTGAGSFTVLTRST